MKILIFGNIGSGKTTNINRLKKFIPFEVIAIDDFRRKYGNGSKESELVARKNFFEAIKPEQNQFIESIGVGKVADELFELLCNNNEQVICLTLLTPKEICKPRLLNRIWDIPFPKPIEEVSSLLERTETKIRAGEINNQWSKRKNLTLISKENNEFRYIDTIATELITLINQNKFVFSHSINDIELMLNKNIQDYYSNEYLSYQEKVIEKNDKFLKDRLMINKFISESNITGNLVDIGSGKCQWFHLFEESINRYYAVEANSIALSLAPKSIKLTTVNENIFDQQFDITQTFNTKIDFAFFSFFFSHFSDKSIQQLLDKLKSINSILIVDSFWSNKHKEKYLTKELREVKRKVSKNEYFNLPKRFFEYSDIENLVKPFGYSIDKFQEGNYWFVCIVKK